VITVGDAARGAVLNGELAMREFEGDRPLDGVFGDDTCTEQYTGTAPACRCRARR
jgi:hypothetical protein